MRNWSLVSSLRTVEAMKAHARLLVPLLRRFFNTDTREGITVLSYTTSEISIQQLSQSKEYIIRKPAGPGCSKLTTSLVNVSLIFQTSIPETHQYFLLKKCEKLLQCKSFALKL